jgi:serine/threonine-protein kinase
MGQVYRARDTKLNRDVALKVLPESFIHDPDRLARFQREAQVLASLNHPNIAHIHGLEESGGVRALVMELVEGEDLAQRIARGVVPIDEALPIAKQIAEALEAAHEQGIIHRDLKPANIKVRADGTVKVLDFGLAKALETAGPTSASLSMSPTITTPAMTQAGMILGTAAYMAPEQARGKPIDRRADIWAFGCVLFEMLAGRQAFDGGETVSDAIAAILRTEPDWSRLPADTPAHIRRLLRRCLQKDPQKRLPHIGIARIEIDDGSGEPMPASPSVAPGIVSSRPLWRRALPSVASLLVGIGVAAAWTLRTTPPASAPITRFPVVLPDGLTLTRISRHSVAISRDGTAIVYLANNRLFFRRMSDLEARPITDNVGDTASLAFDPVFSPDGRSVAYWSIFDGTLKKVAISGGAAVTLCPVQITYGLSWGIDGITIGGGPRGILHVSDAGGKPETLIEIKPGELAASPQMLPDGQTVLFSLTPLANQWDSGKIVVQSLKSGERKIILEGGSDARYLPTGHLVYVLGGTLFAVPFDVHRLEVTSGPVPIVEGVTRSLDGTTGAGEFSVSQTGSLFYLPGPAFGSASPANLALFDPATGAPSALKIPAGTYEHPRVSPDGTQITFGTDDGKEAIVWVYDLSGISAMRRLTFGGRNKFPIWSGDGHHIAFQSDREGDLGIFWQRSDGIGTADRLTRPEQGAAHIAESWLPKGDVLLFSSTTRESVTLFALSVKDRQATPFGAVQSSFPTNATFSPDGHWVAYSSGEGVSTNALYVQPFPTTGTKYRVSSAQGLQPLWSPDGKELFFNPAPSQYMKATITTSPAFSFTTPVQVPKPFLTGGSPTIRNNDMTPDGKILGTGTGGLSSAGGQRNAQLQVVLNWFEELKQRVPTR